MSAAAAGHTLVAEHTVYACVMGSRAFGLATESSDTDRRGVYLAPTPLFWGFEKPPTHVEGPREEEFSWELERFCQLALRANPTILECLHSPLVERIDGTGRELLALRDAFLSRQVHRTFAGLRRRAAQAAAGRRTAARRAPLETRHASAAAAGLLARSAPYGRAHAGRRRGPGGAAGGPARRGGVGVRWSAGWRRLAEEAEAAVSGSPLPAEPDRGRVADFLFRARRASALG